ncbi:MAG: aminotransferase class I/II-fold pyridoxal phosphate-dependent enzyme [Oscillospiraceae bacterium]|nr:aminotransferase class I/II-fold pyridoxal phosphate-dependent enzyme [Oscillospiraceae bacterium]MBR2976876.1 aminotransferase class I/II-fold pyridoxal phosphate-dependent enzyme [Oscillospiraceae bacterium]MBR3849656.1 aminotransferase class I/II-fold pyridoxal phosphate-dependent enzyme [Oscillospiraceae bacterium]
MIPCSKRLEKVHSDIRGPLYQEALRMEAEGTKVLKLNTGNPGKFGFGLPESVRAALAEHMAEAVPYCDMRGMGAARKAICDYHTGRGIKGITPDDIFICNGVSEAASMILDSLIGFDDEILLPSPCYSLWSNCTHLAGATPVFYRCDPNNKWNPDIADIRSKVNDKTKAILIINPNNPTGAVYSKETLLQIAEIAKEKNLVVLSDEIYDRLVMDDTPYDSFAAIAPDVPCVTFNGLSKSHIICGFRCGWMTFCAPNGELDEVKSGVTKLAALRLCGNALTQLVIPAALDDDASTRAMLVPGGRLYEQRKATCEGLDKIDGVEYVENKASFYLFPKIDKEKFDFESAQDFAMQFLHECNVLVIPGTGFEWSEDIRFRIVMLPEPEAIAKAMADLKTFLDRHRK